MIMICLVTFHLIIYFFSVSGEKAYYILQYKTVQYNTIQHYNTKQYNTIQYNTAIQNSTIKYNIHYSTVHTVRHKPVIILRHT